MANSKASAKPEQRKKRKSGKKDAQLLIRISSAERDEFIELCDELDTSAAREIRKFIRGFIRENSEG
ncbi:hypothetical protein TDB9533_00604 [Thalassocella blandensis]|nr:hypothetical protein TDB9533_00604 [Thalassocella blandensis]